MRELTKSMMSFSWAMSLFGLRQLGAMMTPQSGLDRVASSLDAMTQATREQLGANAQSAFQAGDRLQRSMVDMMTGIMGSGGWDPGRWLKMGADTLQQSAEAGSQVFQSSAQAVESAAGAAAAAGCGCGGGQQIPVRPKTGWGPMPPIG